MTIGVASSQAELSLLGQLALELPNFLGSSEFVPAAVSESTLNDCVAGVFLIETYYRALCDVGATPEGLILRVQPHESLMVYVRPSIEDGMVCVELSPKSIRSLLSLMSAVIEWLEVLGDVHTRTGSTSEKLRGVVAKFEAINH
jgi:hypothetical protein